MAEHQAADTSFAGHESSLVGCAVPILRSTVGLLLRVGALVIEEADVFKQLMKRGNIASVGTVGIAAGRIGRLGEPAVRHQGAVGHRPIGPILDVVDVADGNFVSINHVATDMGQQRLLPEKEATAGYAVLQGNALDDKAAVGIDGLMARRVYGVENDFEIEAEAKHLQLGIEHGLELGRGIDMERRRAPQQPERGNHADQAEAVIAMKMGNEDGLNLGETDARSAQKHLRAFTTIDKEQLPAHLNDLSTSNVQARYHFF